MKAFLDCVHKSVNNRLPNGVGQSVFDEQGRLYGRLIHHNRRYSPINPAQFQDLVQTMINLRNGMNKPEANQQHQYEVVIAGFVSSREREYEVLFSTDSLAEVNEVYNELLTGLNNHL